MNEEEIRRGLSEIREKLASVRKTRQEAAVKLAAEDCIPYATMLLQEIKAYNSKLEASPTPEILANNKEALLSLLPWFVEQEELYPGAPWLLVGGAVNMQDRVKCRYNELLYNFGEKGLNRYKAIFPELVTEEARYEETEIIFSTIEDLRRWVDTTASNSSLCLQELNDLHNEVEDIYS